MTSRVFKKGRFVYSTVDIARKLGMRHSVLMISIERMLNHFPELVACLEDWQAKPQKGGAVFNTYMVTGGFLAAFLYWRSCNGKPSPMFRTEHSTIGDCEQDE